MIKIIHFTSVHRRNDTRIFFKECLSAKKKYSAVKLYVADGKGNSEVQSIPIIDIGKPSNRLKRFLYSFKFVLPLLREKANIYHYHDPELFFVAAILKCFRKNIIFDAHENVQLQLKNKDWLPLKKLIILTYPFVDWLIGKLFYVIIAEPSYKNNYPSISKSRIQCVMNFPDLNKISEFSRTDRSGLRDLFYLGGVTELRGIYEMIDFRASLQDPMCKLHIIGPITDSLKDQVLKQIKKKNLENHVIIYGSMGLNEALEISQGCILGFSIMKPIGNYLNSFSTKIFEYMAIGLPFVVSDFKIYKDIGINNKCALLINPTNMSGDYEKIHNLLNSGDDINSFSNMGITMVKNFNWENEETKLLSLYNNILNNAENIS